VKGISVISLRAIMVLYRTTVTASTQTRLQCRK